MTILQIITAAVLTTLLTCLVAWILGRHAQTLRLVDAPGQPRKRHKDAAALTGGIAIFSGWMVACAVHDAYLPFYATLFAGLMLAVGIADDILSLRALHKFALQGLAAALPVGIAGMHIQTLGYVLPDGSLLVLREMTAFFTFFCLIMLLNAWNFIDGLDGLAAGVTLGALFWIGLIWLIMTGDLQTLYPLVMLMAAIIGFLPFNLLWRKMGIAPAFLGDAGSLFLGAMTGYFSITATTPIAGGIPPVVVAWILALPVFDLVSVALRRLSVGRNPMRADKTHLHHLLCRHGHSNGRAAVIVAGLSFAYGGLGAGLWAAGVAERHLIILWLVAFVTQFIVTARMTNLRAVAKKKPVK